MGTWGAGPFDSDSAEELVDSMAEMPEPERAAELERLLSESVEDGQDADPSEVVAAATIVAVNLSGGMERGAYPNVEGWLAPSVAAALRGLAVQAMRVCLPEDGWYWDSWTRESDRLVAHAFVANLTSVLGGR